MTPNPEFVTSKAIGLQSALGYALLGVYHCDVYLWPGTTQQDSQSVPYLLACKSKRARGFVISIRTKYPPALVVQASGFATADYVPLIILLIGKIVRAKSISLSAILSVNALLDNLCLSLRIPAYALHTNATIKPLRQVLKTAYPVFSCYAFLVRNKFRED
jgi:hypothetical protein